MQGISLYSQGKIRKNHAEAYSFSKHLNKTRNCIQKQRFAYRNIILITGKSVDDDNHSDIFFLHWQKECDKDRTHKCLSLKGGKQDHSHP